jgi:predicted transcriptional regulator
MQPTCLTTVAPSEEDRPDVVATASAAGRSDADDGERGEDDEVPAELRSYGYIQRGPTGAKRQRPTRGSLDAKVSKPATVRKADEVKRPARRSRQSSSASSATSTGAGEVFDVEKVLKKRIRAGMEEYLVKWEGACACVPPHDHDAPQTRR